MSREDYAREAYHDGKDAYRAGVGTNPFPWGCLEFAAWARGYENAQELAQDLERQRQFRRMLEGAA